MEAWWEYLMLMPVGLLAGAGGGLLGIGGSVVVIPAMALLFGHEKEHLYQATAMIVNFFVVTPAVIRHRRAKATFRPMTRFMVPGAVVGVLAGVYLSDLPVFRGAGQGYLQVMFALFLGYVVGHNLWRLWHKRKRRDRNESDSARFSKPSIFGIVGLPGGTLSGLLGIGGGTYLVPAQQVCFKVPIRNAVANSATTILWSSVVGAIAKSGSLTIHGYSWSQAVLMAVFLIPTAMVGSWYTAGKVHQWPVGVIRVAFVALLLYCGTRMFMMGWVQAAG